MPTWRPMRLVGCLIALFSAAVAFCCAVIPGTVLAIASPPLRHQAEVPEHAPVQIRLTWGGGTEETWRVVLKASQGDFSDLRVLGLSADSAGSVFIDQQSVVAVPPTPSSFGGFDVTFSASLDTELELEIYPLARPRDAVVRRVTLQALRAGGLSGALDDQENRFLLTRGPGDSIQVVTDRSHLVFAPGETWNVEVRPQLDATQAARSQRCVGRLVRRGAPQQVLKTLTAELVVDSQGDCQPISWSLPMPEREGVYELLIDVETKWYQAALVANRPRRKLQFVVLDHEKPRREKRAEWGPPLPLGAELAKNESANRLNPLSEPWKLFNKNPTGEPAPAGSTISLAPGEWRAIPLRVAQPGVPGKVRVHVESAENLSLGLSILEVDEDGSINHFGFNTGLTVGDALAEMTPHRPGELLTHELLFWPNRNQPWLVVANRSTRVPAVIRQLELLEGPERLEGDAREAPAGRAFLAFAELPLFAENFSGPKVADPDTDDALEDWETFYQAADRLVQYLKHTGQSGMVLSINGQGGTLYPSRHWQGTPRFDGGLLFPTGQDPFPKDVLELLFRMFDREGLTLIPAVTFADPLPEVEAALRQGDDSGIRLLDHRGRSATPSANLPRYNPVSPTVQTAMNGVLEEVLERYAAHQSFRGLAILCRNDTYTVLPGKRWGFDPATVQRFLADRQPGSEPLDPDQLATFIENELFGRRYQEWTAWRAEQMARLYQDWERQLVSHKPEARLMLAGIDLLRKDELVTELSPSLRRPLDLRGAMLELGWSPGLGKVLPNSVWLYPHRVAPAESLGAQRIEVNFWSARDQGASLGFADVGGLVTHRDAWVQWPELGRQLSGARLTDVFRMQPLGKALDAALQPFAEILFRDDIVTLLDGGWILATTDNPRLRDFAQAFSILSPERFEDVMPAGESTLRRPVAVRQRRVGKDWQAYAVNSSPSPVTVRIRFAQNPASCSLVPNLDNEEWDPEQKQLTLQLRPYDLISLSGSGGQLADFQSELPTDSVAMLRGHLLDLQAKLTRAAEERGIHVLADPEMSLEPGLQGWTFQAQPNQRIEATHPDNDSAQNALWISSQDSVAWVRSNWFENLETGRLTVAAWIRTSEPDQLPPLRIAVESDAAGSDYYRFATLGPADPTGSAESQIGSSWKRFVVHFDDLPLDPQARLRIGFDLMGAGQVEIDRVEIFDRAFEKGELQALTQMLASVRPLLANAQTIDEGRFILQGYWPRFVNQMFGEDSSGTDASADSDSTATADQEDDATSNRSGFMFRRLRRR